MSNSRNDPSRRDFICILILLGAIAGSLVEIFSFIATAEISEALGVVLFLVVGGLVVAGYMTGLMVLGLALVPLAKRVSKPRDQPSVAQHA